MKYFLTIILTLLINLPNCGMLFAGTMNMVDHHIHIEIQSMDMDGNNMNESTISHIENSWYDCCSNTSKGILEKNTTQSVSIKYISTVTRISSINFHDFLEKYSQKYTNPIYRPDSPPDPSEYISLVWSSVKNLN